MGIFTNHFIAFVGEKQKIEVEARMDWMGSIECDLVINDEKVDSVRGSLGKFTLRGKVKNGDEERPIKIIVSQRLLGTKAHVHFEDERFPMGKS